MGKITKTMQQKHRDTLSPWLQEWVQKAADAPLPMLPSYLATFPTPWELPRDDLYHWIPLLDRFDFILEQTCSTYDLATSPQMRDFACHVLLKADPVDGKAWDMASLSEHGYGEDGDKTLLLAVLRFSRTLLENCGNRVLYASSSHLNSLLHSVDLQVLAATLEVSQELAKRYQASVRRSTLPSKGTSASLLASHYNIDIDRVQYLSAAFVKTPVLQRPDDMASPSTGKGKEKAQPLTPKPSRSAYCNDLASVVKSDASNATNQWNGWGHVKMSYYPESRAVTSDPSTPRLVTDHAASSSVPTTPTPLRRSATVGSSQQTPRSSRTVAADDSPTADRTPALSRDEGHSGAKTVEIPQSVVVNTPIYDLVDRCPTDMSKATKYEYLHRLRISKALLGSSETRRQILAVRLLAISNLAYIYPEQTFIDKVMRQDNDEPRRNQLIFQLVELVHPSAEGETETPIWLQAIAVSLLEAIAGLGAKYSEVVTALNANVNHGVLLYLMRKAVAQMKEGDSADPCGDKDRWRKALFSLTQIITLARAGSELVTAGILEILVEILNLRSEIAERTFQSIVHFLDNILASFQGAFQYFCNVHGLDAITNLLIHEVDFATKLAESGRGTKPELRSTVMDYGIPYHQQHNLKWLLKFVDHALTNTYSFGGNNTDRLLRNLVDNSALLNCLRVIMTNSSRYGAVVWTAAVTILGDFINNDPTSFGAILESGLIYSYLSAVTGRPPESLAASGEPGGNDNSAEAQDGSQDDVALGVELTIGPPSQQQLEAPRPPTLAAGIQVSAEAVNVIPGVLNSISLSNTGRSLVVNSKSISHFLEIFENPEHVHLMASDPELAQNVGQSFDELARHHPPLRPTIANAVIETLARVVHLGQEKAVNHGWGAKLLLPRAETPSEKEPEGQAEAQTEAQTEGATEGQTGGQTEDADVEMTDAGLQPLEIRSKNSGSPPVSDSKADITPYVYAISVFLGNYIANGALRQHFVDQGGIELLLDLCELPSLPHTFLESHAAHRLQTVLSQLIEHHSVRGLPSLLSRTIEALSDLGPLTRPANHNGKRSFLSPFVGDDEEIIGEDHLREGNRVMKGLLKLQFLLKTVCNCFPYNPRSGSISMHSINVFDYYMELVESLGPLLRAILFEEMSVLSVAPAHWSNRKAASSVGSGTSRNPEPAIADADGRTLEEMVLGTGDAASANRQKKVTDKELSSNSFLNFQTLHVVLHTMVPTTFPFFQNLGKVLFPRRSSNLDAYGRSRHWDVADALAKTMLSQLTVPQDEEPSMRDFHYWIIILHTVHEMLIDPSRGADRTSMLVILPVLITFKAHGGMDALNSLLQLFVKQMCVEDPQGDASVLSKLAALGSRKILDLYAVLASGRNMTESQGHFSIQSSRSSERRPDMPPLCPQLIIELRMSIWPVVVELWKSPIIEKDSIDVLNKVTDILRTIAAADEEPQTSRSSPETRSVQQILRRTPAAFDWSLQTDNIQYLRSQGYDEDLAVEALYRANCERAKAQEYCKAHKDSLAGVRHPIPERDAYRPPPEILSGSTENAGASGDDAQMAIDEPEAANRSADAPMEGEVSASQESHESQESQEDQEVGHEASESSESAGSSTDISGSDRNASATAGEDELDDSMPVVTKDELDAKRAELRKNLIERCLDILRAHHDSAYDISELVSTMVPREYTSDRQEIGETLTNALMSFSVSDAESKMENSQSIAAYAHLLSLLLSKDSGSSQSFLVATKESLAECVGEFLSFLKLDAQSGGDLPPWIPYILLIFEILLREDQSPPDVKWKSPSSLEEQVEEPRLEVGEPFIGEDDRTAVLESVLELLPRIGREETLAVSCLRILVILTRNRSAAKVVGDKKNLQRMFVMAKQLSGMGAERLISSRISSAIMTILRHIVEDEETIKQIMRSDIKTAFDQYSRNSHRSMTIEALVRQVPHSVLRSPELFVEVANEMVKLERWSFSSSFSSHSLSRASISLKAAEDVAEKTDVTDAESASDPTAPGDAALKEVQKTTEPIDKEMTDIQKVASHEAKRPVLENPDGVIHFLLCELITYRDVPDVDPNVSKDGKQPAEGSSSTGATVSFDNTPAVDGKDKKPSKATFKAEEHPIFIYRCFLLNCLAELLQSYNRTKVEFINFKRSAPVQNNTPIKPRSSVLNYLLNDLLCNGPVNGSPETTLAKKMYATSTQAQLVLVSLVSKTGERRIDRGRDRFDYDDEPELLFVQRFVLDTVLKAYKEAAVSSEPFDTRYSRMLCLAELMNQMMGGDKEPNSTRHPDATADRSHSQLKRLMYEKGYLSALTHSIADIDLTFPGVKKTIKYILRVLHSLTQTAIQLSQSNIIPSSASASEDEIASQSSLSDIEDAREETPDLYRNSALGMLEPRDEDDFSGDSNDEDEEMDYDEYDDEEMDYADDIDEEENISDEDEDIEGMGEIEGLPGDQPVIEVVMDDDDDDDDMDDDDPSQDEVDSEHMDDLEDNLEIVDEDGNPMDDDGADGWESESDVEDDGGDDDDDGQEPDYEAEAEEMDEEALDDNQFRQFVQSAMEMEGDEFHHEFGAFNEGYLDEGPEDDDEEDEEDEVEDDEYVYEEDYPPPPPPNMPASLGFDTLVVEHTPVGRFHRVGIHPRHGGRDMGGMLPRRFSRFLELIEQTELIRTNPHRDSEMLRYGRSTPMNPPHPDEGINPLLRRPGTGGPSSTRPGPGYYRTAIGLPPAFVNIMENPMAALTELLSSVPGRFRGAPFQVHISHGPEIRDLPSLPGGTRYYNYSRRTEATRAESYQEPQQAVAFGFVTTTHRWIDEAKLVFGNSSSSQQSKYERVIPLIVCKILPAAMERERMAKEEAEERRKKEEEERKKREEEEKRAREAREAEEKAAREKKEAEERERAEREAAEAAEAAARAQSEQANATTNDASEISEPQPMEGVEGTSQGSDNADTTAAPDQPRIVTTIRGERVDITELGIDLEYLEALPEEFREEVIAQTVSTRRSEARQAADASGEQPEVFQEFLDALPDDLRQEILHQERNEQRRRGDSGQQRSGSGGGNQPPGGQDMDPASILLTFPPEIRQEVLMAQGHELIDQLPPDLADQYRAMTAAANERRAPPAHSRHRHIPPVVGSGIDADRKPARRTVVQMLDQAGVATLLRLMFISQNSNIRSNLFDVFQHVCENHQNRLEVIRSLLQILQDGSVDMNAVERSFSHLSLRAKQPKDKEKDPKTPQSIKRSFTSGPIAQMHQNSEVSPLLIVQQCLDLLVFLCQKNSRVPSLFLTEHDHSSPALRRSLSKKGKVKESKAHKYAINSLLSLLDRDIVMESSVVMGLLADLLSRITFPLANRERKRIQAEEDAKKAAEEAAAAQALRDSQAQEAQESQPQAEDTANTEQDTEDSSQNRADVAPSGNETLPQHPAEGSSSATERAPGSEDVQPSSSKVEESAQDKTDDKKLKQPQLPVIPPHNLMLVVKIFVARECNSKTFTNTISTIKNLSYIPGARAIFGEELVRQAHILSRNIVSDLDELLPHIEKATTGTEIQGIALAKFSPNTSEQNKLLRVLTALDHLFDPKTGAKGAAEEPENQDLLGSLYHNSTFKVMWEKLGSCLSSIRQKENLANVATILLPLIESLMVICKNVALEDSPQTATQKEIVVSSPAPESPISNLFFTFTEEHRRILNDLVRTNPKLMSGTFSLLVKNPKVLEFDNKRNWFNRSVHQRSQTRQNYTLQLSVRRDHVFHDSFRSLYYKSGDEMKYGKLNIRFHGEEGVDAGGVTREWFQVLARQMFDPNYALFIPVSSDRTTFHPNKLSDVNEEHLMFFKFIGRIIGKALYENRLLDCYFSRAVYKRILGKQVSVKDMESFDPDYYKSLLWILENDITDIITETFSVEDDKFGVTNVVDLIENGRNIPVTESNKQDYVRLVVEHKLLSSVKEQMENFLKGFHEIIPADLIGIFNEQELELLISGLPDIDVDDWKANTEYHNYPATAPQIQWFWRAVRSFDKEERAKLLQFVTGTSKVPLNGFKDLEGMNGVSRFNIHRDYGAKDRLPSSHTCFNQLDLPEYESYDVLRTQLLKAITTGSDYFGFA